MRGARRGGLFCPGRGAGILTGVSIPTGRPQGDRNRFELGTDGPRVLVVGVDGSTTSLRAGSYAAGLARRQGAHLVVVYVSRHSGMVGMAPGGAAMVQQAEDEYVAELRALLDERAGVLGLSATFRLEAGDPYTQLVRVADEVAADGVVVGASQSAGHRFAGSIAVRLARAGRWPVTVVP
jgi:nucleotide-binding universal stress UspA family protein